MKITQNKYYQINTKQKINSNRNYTSAPSFKMAENKTLQTIDKLEKTAQQAGFWTKIKSLLAGSFLAGLFGLSINNNTENNTDKTEESNNENITNNEKIQSEKIFEIENFIDNIMLLEEFFKLNPNIDINSKNKNGDTIILKAIRENNYKILHKLKQFETAGLINGINWNAVDSNGKNGLMLAIEQINSREIKYLKERHYIEEESKYRDSDEKRRKDKYNVEKINNLLNWGVNPNYINRKTKFDKFYCTPLQEMIFVNNSAAIEAMLKFPKTDINISHSNTPPSIFLLDDYDTYCYATFKNMVEHRTFDFNKEYNGKNIYEHLSSSDFYDQKDMLEIIERTITQNAREKLKKYYQEKGEFNLEQLYEYLNLPLNSRGIEEPLNEIKQNIVHFVASVYVDNFEDRKKMDTIVKKNH